jgi:nucleotidyltransferase substrate binding protein (TIGR01987 family)
LAHRIRQDGRKDSEMSWKILNKIEAQSLLDAHAALQRSLAQPENEFIRNSSIQCFEFTLELVWKTLKRVLEIYGIEVSNSRDAFRAAVKIQVIESPEVWFRYIELRNLSSHIYKEEVAVKIYNELNQFDDDVKLVITRLRQLI